MLAFHIPAVKDDSVVVCYASCLVRTYIRRYIKYHSRMLLNIIFLSYMYTVVSSRRTLYRYYPSVRYDYKMEIAVVTRLNKIPFTNVTQYHISLIYVYGSQ